MFPTSDADFVGSFALLQIVRTIFDAHYFIRCWPNQMFRSFVHRLYMLCFIVLSILSTKYPTSLHPSIHSHPLTSTHIHPLPLLHSPCSHNLFCHPSIHQSFPHKHYPHSILPSACQSSPQNSIHPLPLLHPSRSCTPFHHPSINPHPLPLLYHTSIHPFHPGESLHIYSSPPSSAS